MKETINRHNENINKLKSENDKLTSSLNNMNVEYNSKSSKKKILEGMENDYAGYSKSVKSVLKAEELKKNQNLRYCIGTCGRKKGIRYGY